jgi:hypothetical protein
MEQPPETNGSAAAALISPGIGALLMMISHHIADTQKPFETWLWGLGMWMPGSKTGDKLYGEIGSYSGKATVILVGWLVAWALLHLILRDRTVRPSVLFGLIMVLFMAATVMAWHPLFSYLPLTAK